MAQIVRLALPIMFLPLVARELAPAEAGRYLLYFQIGAWFGIFAEFGSTIYLVRRLTLAVGLRASAQVFWSDYLSRFMLFAAAAPVVWAAAALLGADPLLLALAIACGWLLGAGLPLLRQFDGSIAGAVAIELATVVTYVAGMTTLFSSAPSAAMALAVFAGSLAISHVLQLVAVARPGRLAPARIAGRALRLARRQWRLLALRGCSALESQATIPILAVVVGASQAAVYGMAERLFAVTSNLVVVVMAAASPVLTRWALSGDPGHQRRVVVFAFAGVAIYAGGCVILMIFSEPIIRIAFGAAYAAAGQYVPLLAAIYTAQVATLTCLAAFIAPRGLGARMLPAFGIGAVSVLIGGLFLARLGVTAVLALRLAVELMILASALTVLRRPGVIPADANDRPLA